MNHLCPSCGISLSMKMLGQKCPKCKVELKRNEHPSETVITKIILVTFGIAAPVQFISLWYDKKELFLLATLLMTLGLILFINVFRKIPNDWPRWKI